MEETGILGGARGAEIFWRRTAPGGVVRGVVVFCHGLGDHSGRYERLAERLHEEGLAVFALDMAGHGRSSGERLYIRKFRDYCNDVVTLARLAKASHPGRKAFVVGHSLGALVAMVTCDRSPAVFSGAVLCSPTLLPGAGPSREALTRIRNRLAPSAPAEPFDTTTLCHDPHVVAHFLADPLVAKQPPTKRLATRMTAAGLYAQRHASRFKVPYLLMHGTEDSIAPISGSETFHSRTKIEDKTFISIDGGYHELFHEPDAEEVALQHTAEWIRKRCDL